MKQTRLSINQSRRRQQQQHIAESNASFIAARDRANKAKYGADFNNSTKHATASVRNHAAEHISVGNVISNILSGALHVTGAIFSIIMKIVSFLFLMSWIRDYTDNHRQDY